jgi:hypothetical protein
VPVAGGLAVTGLAYARDIGAEVVQVFVANPHGWAAPVGSAITDRARTITERTITERAVPHSSGPSPGRSW